MSFTIALTCIRKTQSLEGDNTYTEIVLQPESSLVVPSPSEENPPAEYGMHGTVTFTIRNSTEADAYKVGETYELSLSSTPIPEEPSE